MKRRSFIKATGSLAMLACLAPLFTFAGISEAAGKTRVLVNGKIYTVNKKQPWAEAVVIKDNKIAYVGDNAGARKFAPAGEIEDLGGKFMMPGLIDGHVHPVLAVVLKSMIRFTPQNSVDDIKRIIKEYMAKYPDLPAYCGMGWMDALFGVEGPKKEFLDELCPDKPMILLSGSGHVAWCNSKAFEIAKVDKNTPDPDKESGIYYYRDKDGNPTGYIKESGCINHILNSAQYINEDFLNKDAKEFMERCAKLGFTGMVDCGSYDFCVYLMHDNLKEALDAPEAVFRMTASGYLTNKINVQTSFDEIKLLNSKYQSDRFRCYAMKVLNDGTLENFSAAMPNYPEGMPPVRPVMSADDLEKWGIELAKAGLDLNVHAVGSLTVHAVLEAAGRLRAKGYKDIRIECSHTGYVFTEDLPLFKKYNVVANFTPKWVSAMTAMMAEQNKTTSELDEIKKWESDISQAHAYPIGSIQRTGARVSFSSDYPQDVHTFEPMEILEVALTRQTVGDRNSYINEPEDRIQLPEAIEAYTINNAYLMHMEDKIGSIEAGKYADMIVLDHNLFETDPYEIHNVNVVETIMDGVTRFKK